MAAQFTLMNGLSRRDEPRCSAFAMSSLPVPLSPVMSTVDGESATRADHLVDRRASTGDVADERAGASPSASRACSVLALEVVRAGRLGDDLLQLVLLERLGDVVEGAGLERLDRAVDGAVGGDDDDRHVGEVASTRGGAAPCRRASASPGR